MGQGMKKNYVETSGNIFLGPKLNQAYISMTEVVLESCLFVFVSSTSQEASFNSS